MPRTDGTEVYDLLKEKHPDIPIIFYSAYPGDEKIAKKCLELKPYAFVEKGVTEDNDRLYELIEKAAKGNDMLERAARETQMSLKKGDVPRFLVSNVHFDPDDAEGLEFYIEMVRRGVAYGCMPNMRTTHAFGDLDMGLLGFHEGTTFAHVLTWSPNAILPDYKAFGDAFPAIGRLHKEKYNS